MNGGYIPNGDNHVSNGNVIQMESETILHHLRMSLANRNITALSKLPLTVIKRAL